MVFLQIVFSVVKINLEYCVSFHFLVFVRRPQKTEEAQTMSEHPYIQHLVSILRLGNEHQLRILYQVIRAVIEPEYTRDGDSER